MLGTVNIIITSIKTWYTHQNETKLLQKVYRDRVKISFRFSVDTSGCISK